MLVDDIQRELLGDTLEPERALSIAINIEMGYQNQQRISFNKTSGVIAIQRITRFLDVNTRKQQRNRNKFNRESIGLFRNCGQSWTTTHLQVCPALGMKCNHCGLLNHFAEVCWKKLKENININNKKI